MKIFFLLLASVFLFASCAGEEGVSFSVQGYVYDIEKNPVAGLSVSSEIFGRETLTDEKGFFSLSTSVNYSKDKQSGERTALIFSKEGYSRNIKIIEPFDGITYSVLATVKKIDSIETKKIPEGSEQEDFNTMWASLRIYGDSVVNSVGKKLTGEMKITLIPFVPSSLDLYVAPYTGQAVMKDGSLQYVRFFALADIDIKVAEKPAFIDPLKPMDLTFSASILDFVTEKDNNLFVMDLKSGRFIEHSEGTVSGIKFYQKITNTGLYGWGKPVLSDEKSSCIDYLVNYSGDKPVLGAQAEVVWNFQYFERIGAEGAHYCFNGKSGETFLLKVSVVNTDKPVTALTKALNGFPVQTGTCETGGCPVEKIYITCQIEDECGSGFTCASGTCVGKK